MPVIAWYDNLSVNIMEIDDQHKRLISMINELHDAMQEGKGSGVLGRVLDELISYTQIHFSTEERHMYKSGFPAYGDHKIEHDLLTKKVMEIKELHESGKSGLTIQVSIFLNDWLQRHIMGCDKVFGSYLKSKMID